jgi:hypothetical protein
LRRLSFYENDQRKLKKKKTFPKSEDETGRRKEKRRRVLKRDRKREREREGFVLFLLIGLLLEWGGFWVAWGLVNEAEKVGREEDWCES